MTHKLPHQGRHVRRLFHGRHVASLVDQLSSDIFPQIVRWYVLQNVLHLPIDDMDKFHALFEEGNARPVQNLNGRPVFRDQKQNPR